MQAYNAGMAQKRQVLVVEDDQSLNYFIKKTVERAGHRAIIAFDGEEAINIARSETLGLVLLDIVLPKLTGWDVLKYLRNDPKLKDIPVVVMSNLESPVHEDDFDMGIATEYIVKVNSSEKELLALIQKYLS